MLFVFALTGSNMVLLGLLHKAVLMETYDVFPRARVISDSTLSTSCSSIMPLIMIGQEIIVKQVNYSFGSWPPWYMVQQAEASGKCPCAYATRAAT